MCCSIQYSRAIETTTNICDTDIADLQRVNPCHNLGKCVATSHNETPVSYQDRPRRYYLNLRLSSLGLLLGISINCWGIIVFNPFKLYIDLNMILSTDMSAGVYPNTIRHVNPHLEAFRPYTAHIRIPFPTKAIDSPASPHTPSSTALYTR